MPKIVMKVQKNERNGNELDFMKFLDNLESDKSKWMISLGIMGARL